MTFEKIKEYLKKLPSNLFKQDINSTNPFVFIDFEVFAKDWLMCFSADGVTIKSIVNDVNKLKHLFMTVFKDRIIVAYNGNGYDKYIMMALLNGINPKIVNDKIINTFNYNFYREYGKLISKESKLIWYDPSSRLGGSLKTYEACKGENIYESNVDFTLDRKLTQDEINETIKYCSFDVKQLIDYFYEIKYPTFLGHLGLVLSVLEQRDNYKFGDLISKTDAFLTGAYLCLSPIPILTKDTDTISIPNNLNLGKYEKDIKSLLDTIPINTLKKGVYNDLNAWAYNLIDKAINDVKSTEKQEKLDKKIESTIKRIKKVKLDLKTLKEKDSLTEKQTIKLNEELPEKLKSYLETVKEYNHDKQQLTEKYSQNINLIHKVEKMQAEHIELDNNEYRQLIHKIITLSDITVSNQEKYDLLLGYLAQSDLSLFNFQYKENKKESIYNSITLERAFEIPLMIKGVQHSFKTGGIHSIADEVMIFDPSTNEDDAKRKLIIADVSSLYPNIMVHFGLCSRSMENPSMYAQMIIDRISLKKQKDPFANVLKLILNTTYGCMGSDTNPLYDPENRLKVCIYGQCAILDLLDKLENQIQSLKIYQSNTDGIIISCYHDEYDMVESIIRDWECRTHLEMEIDLCKFLWQKDVSNYVLIEEK